MPGFAVISAFNPYNYGMYSVDLAAEKFFRELGLPFTQIVTQQRIRTGSIRFKLVRTVAELAEFEAVVYWGDFLNNPMWGRDDYSPRELKRHGVRDAQQAFHNWTTLYLEVKRHLPHVRVFAVGGCFLGAEGPALGKCENRFKEFIRSAELVTPRDQHSLEIVRRLEPTAPALPGLDCAWLLPVDAVQPPAASDYFVCFLGRTLRGRKNGFLQDVAKQTGLQPVWIDWLNLRRPRFLAHWRFEQMSRLIRGARFVVTDTYHLVVNSLKHSIPAISLYDATQSATSGTCGDFKKRALLEQVGLPCLLVAIDDPSTLAARILSRLDSPELHDFSATLGKFAVVRANYLELLRKALMPMRHHKNHKLGFIPG